MPPAGGKVLRPTLIRRGARARRIGCAHLLPEVAAAAFALWGYVQAGAASAQARYRAARPPGGCSRSGCA